MPRSALLPPSSLPPIGEDPSAVHPGWPVRAALALTGVAWHLLCVTVWWHLAHPGTGLPGPLLLAQGLAAAAGALGVVLFPGLNAWVWSVGLALGLATMPHNPALAPLLVGLGLGTWYARVLIGPAAPVDAGADPAEHLPHETVATPAPAPWFRP